MKKPLSVQRVRAAMEELYPSAACELDFTTAFELLIATVLSAQTTDVRVNQTTPELFRRWPDPDAMAQADPEEVRAVLHPLGMGARRAGQVIGLSQQLLQEHDGQVPNDQAALEALPGVGRKTAHVVRGNWFGASLLTVDTHVGRLTRRFGWSQASSPLRIEKDVVERVDATAAEIGPTDLTRLSHQLILHGRLVCAARRPDCGSCPLADACPSAGITTGTAP